MSKMSGFLRQSFSLPKLLVYHRKPCFKYLSTLSVIADKQNRNYNSNKLIYPQVYVPKQIQVRNFSLVSPYSFYDSVTSSEACKLFKQIIIQTHDSTGLPWFVTIISWAVFMKLAVSAPCAIYQQYLVAKLELIRLELRGKMKSIKEKLVEQAKKEKWTEKKLLSNIKIEIHNEWKKLVVTNNCHPFKCIILFFVQFPFWLLLTLAIRSLAVEASRGISDHPVAALQFTLGGPFWCQNLILPDPTFILPTINCLAMLANTEISLSSRDYSKMRENKPKSFSEKFFSVIVRLFPLAFFFISAASPSGVSLFWASSSLIALAQSLFLMSPKIRRFCRIPKTPFEFDKPFSDSWSVIKGRFFSRK